MTADTYTDLPEDERPHGVENAKAKVAEMLADPKFQRDAGHEDVDRTRDDAEYDESADYGNEIDE